MPVSWEELAKGVDPQAFDTKSVPKRLADKRRRDPWKDFEKSRRHLDVSQFAKLTE